MKVLVVEDEFKVANAIKEGLEQEGYKATLALTGEDGYFLATTDHFDLILLDIMLPGRDGLEILGKIREQGQKIPILMLTARDTIEDRVLGLDSGADDYLVKPFAFPELVARIRALLRRGNTEEVSKLTIAQLQLDRVKRKVSRNGQQISLTLKEYELLEYLLSHKEEVVTRQMLAKEVWDVNERATSLNNVIDVHINHLRSKIDDPFDKPYLKTIRGVGFILTEEGK